ncbi:MAG: SelB C-terminal domain-containing protein [Candidatus Rokubacteria bacterium]|nr:SelB C-terminal domain-containing protein [Candidatus Rokubacteria bacterium]
MKDLFGISRKYAIPLMEYFDGQRVTQRVGDKRVLPANLLTAGEGGRNVKGRRGTERG